MENTRRIDAHSGAVVYAADTPETAAKRKQQSQMDELLAEMRGLKQQVANVAEEVTNIKKLMLKKTKGK